MALFPPCHLVQILLVKRPIYVAKLWKSSLSSGLDYTDIAENGRSPNESTVWAEDLFPREAEKNLCDEDGESLISKTPTKTLMIVTAVLKMNSIRLKSERMDAVIYKVAECFLMLFLWILSVFFSQNLFLPWFFLQEGLKRTEIGITKASVIYWLAYINISQSGCSFIMFTTTRNMS